MNKNFITTVGNIGSEIQDTSSAFATIIKRFVNRRYFQILRAINWQNIQPDYTFNTVAGQQRYVLPDDFGKEIACTDTTNDTELSRTTLEKLYEDFKDISDSGTVEAYAIIEDCVQAQPTSASVLAITCASSADTTQTLFIRGIVSGVETYESITLNGGTQNSVNSYTRIKGISKSAVTAGKLTITSNSAAVTIAIIPKETLETRYILAVLHYVPSSTSTIAMPYIIKPMPLSQDYDYPVIDIADLIELGAMSDAWKYKRQFSKAKELQLDFYVQLGEFIWDKVNQPNQIHQFVPQPYSRETV